MKKSFRQAPKQIIAKINHIVTNWIINVLISLKQKYYLYIIVFKSLFAVNVKTQT